MTELEFLELFSKNLKRMMKEDNMTQEDLAEELGLSQSAVSRYITGQSIPSTITLIKISEALCCTLDDLIS